MPGGTSAGKTFGILPILIDRAIRTPMLEISVVSESVPHLRKGALKDFLKIMKSTNRYIDKNYNKTHLTYTFENGSYIEFFSVDQEDKVRGPRRNVLYMNEANNNKFDTFHQLSIRTSHEIWLDFNPSNEFWAHEELMNDVDAEWLTLTYKDNEALPETIGREIEKAKEKAKTSSYWANWWEVYGLGQLGKLEGVIFNNWKAIDKIPDEAQLLGGGIDFGFTNDPTTLTAIYKWNGKYIFDELIYEKGLTNDKIAKKIKDFDIFQKVNIYCDSAEPKSIFELMSYGINARAAIKGADSIKFGINLLLQNDFYVTKESVNLINELRKYSWDKSKEGKTMTYPIDDYNHVIDGIRYYVQSNAAVKKIRYKRS